MEENHSESAGSSVTSWDVDLRRAGSTEFVRGMLLAVSTENLVIVSFIIIALDRLTFKITSK
jgi:hypothetical protein